MRGQRELAGFSASLERALTEREREREGVSERGEAWEGLVSTGVKVKRWKGLRCRERVHSGGRVDCRWMERARQREGERREERERRSKRMD